MSKSIFQRIGEWSSLVKFAHTIFALPFALIGFTIAVTLSEYSFSWVLLLQVLGCMVFARNLAMGFNRYIDRHIDKENPRTANREIPSGVISPSSALWFVVINGVLFVAVAYTIQPLCFYLSPVALLLLLGYSLAKRFTSWCHIILGLCLAIAPTAAYISVTGEFGASAAILSVIVMLWTAGFDILYSLSDEEFDRSHNLHSIPQLFGKRGAFVISSLLHIAVAPLLVWLYFVGDFGVWYSRGGFLCGDVGVSTYNNISY